MKDNKYCTWHGNKKRTKITIIHKKFERQFEIKKNSPVKKRKKRVYNNINGLKTKRGL